MDFAGSKDPASRVAIKPHKQGNSSSKFSEQSLLQTNAPGIVFAKIYKAPTHDKDPWILHKGSFSLECPEYPFSVIEDKLDGTPIQWPTVLHYFQVCRLMALSQLQTPVVVKDLSFLYSEALFRYILSVKEVEQIRIAQFRGSRIVDFFRQHQPSIVETGLINILDTCLLAWDREHAVDLLTEVIWKACMGELSGRYCRGLLLLQTGDAWLGQHLTHNNNDPWSISADGRQAGYVGMALMRVRAALREAWIPQRFRLCAGCTSHSAVLSFADCAGEVKFCSDACHKRYHERASLSNSRQFSFRLGSSGNNNNNSLDTTLELVVG